MRRLRCASAVAVLVLALSGAAWGAEGPGERLRYRFPEHAEEIVGDSPGGFAAIGSADEPEGFARLAVGADAIDPDSLEVLLPAKGQGPMTLTTPDGFSVEVVELGAHGPGRCVGGAVAYEREGGVSYWKATPSGAEEWLLLEGGGAPDSAMWLVRGGELVQDGDAVHVVDSSGLPRIRVVAPRAFLESGQELPVRLRAAGNNVVHASVERPPGSFSEALLLDPAWGWVKTGPLLARRYHHVAALLHNGDVLVTGGAEKLGTVDHYLRSTEIYHPGTGMWTPAASLLADANNADSAVLLDGRVFVNSSPGQVYDPALDVWTSVSSYGHEKIVVLPDGRVFKAGGWNSASVAVYDPSTDVETPLPNLTYRRTGHTLAVFHDGAGTTPWKVLAIGGRPGPAGDYTTTNSAEYFDFDDMQWHLLPLMPEGYWEHNMVLLTHGPNAGKLFVFGGIGGVNTAYFTRRTVLFDPVAKTFSEGPLTHHVGQARGASIANNGAITTEGYVVFAGGHYQSSELEVLDPHAMQWGRLCPLTPGRLAHSTTALLDGTVLLTGGESAYQQPLANPCVIVSPGVEDVDGDHHLGGCDNCPTVHNPDQADRDQNGVGDACDEKNYVRGSFFHDQDGSCDVSAGDIRVLPNRFWAVATDLASGVAYFAPAARNAQGLSEYSFALSDGTYSIASALPGSASCPPSVRLVSVAGGTVAGGNDFATLGVLAPCSDPVIAQSGGPGSCSTCPNPNPFDQCVNTSTGLQAHPIPNYPWTITTAILNPGTQGWDSLFSQKVTVTLNTSAIDFLRCGTPTFQWFDASNNPVAAPGPINWSITTGAGQSWVLRPPGTQIWPAGYTCVFTVVYCVDAAAAQPFISQGSITGPNTSSTAACKWSAPEVFTYSDSGNPCDPNDMQVIPEGCGSSGAIAAQELTYRVRFENIGSGPAHDVEIWSYPSENSLDLMSLKLLDSSFPVTSAQIEPASGHLPTRIVFRLKGIELPPPHPSAPGANQGYIRFALTPREPFEDGTVCLNYADIYFDTEAPVRTNTVVNTLYHGGPVPRAEFQYARSGTAVPPVFDFTYTGGTSGASFLWHLGDGATPRTSTEASPAGVVYDSPGVRVVLLEVDRAGCVAFSAQAIEVGCEPAPSGAPLVLWGVPGDTVASCDSVPSPAEVIALDLACEPLEVTLTETQAPGPGTGSFTLIRTWSATDPLTGMTVSRAQTILVLDQPVLVGVPGDIEVECAAAVPPAAPVTAYDSCDPIASLTLEEVETEGATPGAFTLLRTWTVIDSHGNSASASQTITVAGDVTSPTLLGVPADIRSIDIGTLPGGAYGRAAAVDGGQVVGWSTDELWNERAFSWTQAGGMVDLGHLGGSYSIANAVSEGMVVGWSATDEWYQRAFVWTPAGGMVDIGHLGSGYSEAVAVDRGQVVGWTYDQDWNHALFSWTEGGGMVDMGHLGARYGEVRAVDRGQVVGVSYDALWRRRAFRWTAEGGMVDLGDLGGGSSEARDVSEGMVVGWSTTSSGQVHAFAWTAESGLVDLGTLGGPHSYAYAADGRVVAGMSQTADGRQHAFRWTQAEGMVDLGTLGGPHSIATAANGGRIAGRSIAADGRWHAFLWSAGGGMVDAQPPGWRESFAVGVDASGNVAGYGMTLSREQRPFFGSEVPAETTVECASAVPPVAAVTATDSCDPSPTVSFEETRVDDASGPVPSYTLLRRWTATDAAGNSASGTHTIHVVPDDRTAPTLHGVPGDQSALCAEVPPPAPVTASDSCDPQPALTLSESVEEGGVAGQYTLFRTWTATDASGNSASRTQTISVYDGTPPALAGVPGDALVECSAVPPAALVSARDDCDPAPTVAFAEERIPGSLPGSYTLRRTWTARDASGNSSTGVQRLTVYDETPPALIGVPGDETVLLDEACEASLPVPEVTARDACTSDGSGVRSPFQWRYTAPLSEKRSRGLGTMAVSMTIGPYAGKVLVIGGWRLREDGSGALELVRSVEAYDPATETWSTLAPLPEGRVEHTATEIRAGPYAGLVLLVGGYSVNIDYGGGTSIGTAEVYDPSAGIVATLAPPHRARNGPSAANLPGGKILVAGGSGESSAEVYDPHADTWTLDASFVSSTLALPFLYRAPATSLASGEVVFVGGMFGIGYAVRVYDPHTGTARVGRPPAIGKTAHGLATVGERLVLAAGGYDWDGFDAAEVYDVDADVWLDAGSLLEQHVECFAGSLPGNRAIIIGGFNFALQRNTPVCEVFELVNAVDPDPTVTFSEVRAEGPYPAAYTLTRTWSARDASGNVASASQTITVVDAEPPSIACPPSVVVASDPGSCSASSVRLGSPSVTDLCGVAAVWAHVPHADDPSCAGGPGLHEPDGTFPQGSTTVVWTAADQAGNTASCPQTVTVIGSATVSWRPPLAGQPVANKVRRGQVVPHKVEVAGCAGGALSAGITVRLKVVGIEAGPSGEVVFQDVIEDANGVGADGTVADDGIMMPTGGHFQFNLDTSNFADPNTFGNASRFYRSTATVVDNATGTVLGSGSVVLETRQP